MLSTGTTIRTYWLDRIFLRKIVYEHFLRLVLLNSSGHVRIFQKHIKETVFKECARDGCVESARICVVVDIQCCSGYSGTQTEQNKLQWATFVPVDRIGSRPGVKFGCQKLQITIVNGYT